MIGVPVPQDQRIDVDRAPDVLPAGGAVDPLLDHLPGGRVIRVGGRRPGYVLDPAAQAVQLVCVPRGGLRPVPGVVGEQPAGDVPPLAAVRAPATRPGALSGSSPPPVARVSLAEPW